MISSPGKKFSRELASENGYDLEAIEFLECLTKDYPEFRFVFGRKFTFRPSKTIAIGPLEPHWQLLVLHELSHALLKHKSFKMDAERLKMESAAWEQARKLASRYNIEVDESFVQEELDTYRDWLHKKSRCPVCGLTRFQTPDSKYHCPRCENLT